MSILSEKSTMRRAAAARRDDAWRALGGAVAAVGLRDRFLAATADMALPVGGAVSGYFAMAAEIDPAPLLDALRAAGRDTVFPVVTGKDQPLLFRRWSPGDALESGVFGTRHPAAGLAERDPAVVLAPLLAFDRGGGRLGYGGGFYDRTIARLRGRGAVTTIGVAFSAQEVDRVPVTDQDQRLDWIVTECEAFKAT